MPPKTPFGCIREALKALDELESNQTCNDFDIAQEALSDLDAVEARVAELEASQKWAASNLAHLQECEEVIRLERDRFREALIRISNLDEDHEAQVISVCALNPD